MTYLLDTSTWAQATFDTAVAERLAGHIRNGELALCTITALEVLYSARNAAEYERDLDRLRGCPGGIFPIRGRPSISSCASPSAVGIARRSQTLSSRQRPPSTD